MGEISIKRYMSEDKTLWNNFITNSKMPMFMFHRNYMDYHKDRFVDNSLMFYENETLQAILPANIGNNKVLVSHGGLTYGGLLLSSTIKQHTVLDCFDALVDYCKNEGIKTIIYKPIPHIYHEQPAEEDIYALYKIGAHLSSVSASTVVNLNNPLKMPKGRKAQISRAKREGVVVKKTSYKNHYDDFIHLENEILRKRHNTSAVHTSDELFMLHERFPEQINLFAAFLGEKLIAGTIIYEYGKVIHTQYMAADETAREIGALDLTINTIIEEYRMSKLWLDFGISTENDGQYLNEGLISQKEGFGGRTNVYQHWRIEV